MQNEINTEERNRFNLYIYSKRSKQPFKVYKNMINIGV